MGVEEKYKRVRSKWVSFAGMGEARRRKGRKGRVDTCMMMRVLDMM